MLAAPYAPKGGGMGRIMEYLAAEGEAAGARFVMLESRGAAGAWGSLYHLLLAAIRLVSERPAILHLNVAEGASVARKGALLLLARALGCKTVLHIHAADIVDFHAGLPRPAQALMAAIFRRADICIVLGAAWRNWLTRSLRVAPSRIVLLPNGVPQPEQTRPPLPDPVFTLLFLGNLLPRKGLPDLLHALALSNAAPKPPWRLVIAGGGDTAPTRRLADMLGLAVHIRFTGWLDRAATTDLLRAAHALVLPSYREALPLVLLEAASLGVPAIASSVGAIPDLFTDGATALLVPPGDRVALAAAIGRFMHDPALRRALGANARALYAENFTMARFVGGLRAVYAGLLEGRDR